MLGWRTDPGSAGGPAHLVCEALARAGLPHAFTLKPSSDGDAGARPGPPAETLSLVGLEGVALFRPAQVHGAEVARPSGAPPGTLPGKADAVVVRGAGAAAIATADCVGAIVAAPEAGAFAVVHAGWRGTIAGALPAAIRALAAESGARPEAMIVALGPSIGGCCYEVGSEVADRFRAAFAADLQPPVFGRRGDATTLDLSAANRHQAIAEGIPASSVHACGICTSCRNDICWSYRREGPRAGRMWTLAGLKK